MKLFISWSGATSRLVAEALSEWLPKVIQGLEPFVSAKDIDKGSNWTVELSRVLEDADFGIVCLAPDNLLSPWLNYEAGAITKSVNSRVCPVLFNVDRDAVQPPLSQLQITEITPEDFLLLMASINKAAGNPLSLESLKESVGVWWPRLESSIQQIPVPEIDATSSNGAVAEPAKPAVDLTEMLEEVLRHVRRLDDRMRRIERPRPLSPTSTPVRVERLRPALSYLEQRFTDVGLSVTSVGTGNTGIEVILSDPLPESPPKEILDAGRAVATREKLQVQYISPGTVLTFDKGGDLEETPF